MARIGVDFSVTAGKFQGSRSYLLGLYGAAIAVCPHHEFHLYTPDPATLAGWAPADGANVRVTRLETGFGAYGRLALWLPRAVRRDRIDVVHTQYMLPLTRRARRITTIHDVLFEDFPQFFPAPFRLRSRVLIRASARMADRVLTVSGYCAERIMRHYGVPEHRLAITANGVDPARFGAAARDDALYRALGLDGPGYILAVGRVEARKNIAALVRAHARLAAPRPQLAIVGRIDPEFHDAGVDLTAPGVVHLASVADAELPALYAGAALLAYPSLAEGFGMPLVEAMASGTPVVCSDRTAIPEVAGDAALVVDPMDADAFAAAMHRVLTEPALAARRREAGSARARHYSWDAAATVLGKVLDALA